MMQTLAAAGERCGPPRGAKGNAALSRDHDVSRGAIRSAVADLPPEYTAVEPGAPAPELAVALDTPGKVADFLRATGLEPADRATAGERDASEIFTVTPDLPAGSGLPCHGPAPCPDSGHRAAMEAYPAGVGGPGERLLRLVALGLGLGLGSDGAGPGTGPAGLTRGGWHHMRVLRFPAASRTTERGIAAHTDRGLLGIGAQDEVGGLSVRPPIAGESS
ncbi:hypothetical protein [Streptomyces sp. NPDC006463]|uniref:hypothetical protein n=1 Tax=Streptomyces sp. NPDC006463 TaxID=3364746 RepID=UPI0036877B20